MMNSIGPKLVLQVDLKKKPWEQNPPLHNRWHPEIPPVADVRVREVFRVEMVDFSGGGITKDYTAEDIKHADQSVVSSSLHSRVIVFNLYYFYSTEPLFRTSSSFLKEKGLTRS
ncbi:hypothetical protein FXO37_08051 [Capsicum annuum]|nr:hypothetical protein FXO37_08051 [Capsicum annuum]